MKNPFTLFDMELLKRSYHNATIAHDCLPVFLNSYTFDQVYETSDNTIVFDAGGKNRIEIEFSDFSHPLKRKCSVMYWENEKPYIIEL